MNDVKATRRYAMKCQSQSNYLAHIQESIRPEETEAPLV